MDMRYPNTDTVHPTRDVDYALALSHALSSDSSPLLAIVGVLGRSAEERLGDFSI
jgi:hypothetical protein